MLPKTPQGVGRPITDRAAWEATLKSGKATYYSRSRKKLWVKGESSGNVQMIREIRIDCDNDTLLFKVEQIGGAACHTGHKSCFFQRVEAGAVGARSLAGSRIE